MKLDQYTYRRIRAHVIHHFNLEDPNICIPPAGTTFHFMFLLGVKRILLFCSNSRSITVAHNSTKTKDIWVGPIDATRSETINNPHIKQIRAQLIKDAEARGDLMEGTH